MQLVSEQSEAEIRANRALKQLKPALRQLAANIMRISRGAGASYRLGDQMIACLNAMAAYQEAAGHGVAAWDLDEILDPDVAYTDHRPWVGEDLEAQARWEAEGTIDCQDADRDVRNASLQIVASILVNQLTHQRRGEMDLFEAIKRREAARDRRRSIAEAKVAPSSRKQRGRKA